MTHAPNPNPPALLERIQALGFSDGRLLSLEEAMAAVADAQQGLEAWLAEGCAGEMSYLERSLALRADLRSVLPEVKSLLLVCLDYLPDPDDWQRLEAAALLEPGRAVVSVYARGRDYHKVGRQRLARLAGQIEQQFPGAQHRACVDSAPVHEVALAAAAGLGWRGKNTLLLSRSGGSMFFLGVLLSSLELEEWGEAPGLRSNPQAMAQHCGSCTACLAECPTQAIIAPGRLDARRCISYLTIEHAGSIPVGLRPGIGQRVYGCDDCQRVCPWNKFARRARLPDFAERHGLGTATIVELLDWSEADFRERHAGSAILRIGHHRWRRNLAVAAGNALAMPTLTVDLRARLQGRLRALRAGLSESQDPGGLLREHLDWALAQEPGPVDSTSGALHAVD